MALSIKATALCPPKCPVMPDNSDSALAGEEGKETHAARKEMQERYGEKGRIYERSSSDDDVHFFPEKRFVCGSKWLLFFFFVRKA